MHDQADSPRLMPLILDKIKDIIGRSKKILKIIRALN